VSGLLNKILAQLPKPDSGLPFMQHHEAVPAVQELQPAASASAAESGAAGGSGDGFWDRSVHVTESTLQSNQQLVPNNNLLDPNSAPVRTARWRSQILMLELWNTSGTDA